MATSSKKPLINRGNYQEVSIPRRLLTYLLAGIFLVTVFATVSRAQAASSTSKVCDIPTAGSIVTNPPEIRMNASHPVNFSVRNISDKQDCYVANGEMAAPTLRVNPSDVNQTILLNLTNKLPKTTAMAAMTDTVKTCAGGMPPQNSTNLHFHGMNVSPQCHQDEVVKTVIQPGETFEYKVKIPGREPPGLYWYHPHIHKQSEDQVLKGLTGVLIVEGIGKFNPQAAKLPERVFVLRDMRLLSNIPKDDKNAPAKDISLNSVPIRYRGSGKYEEPAVVQIAANQEQFWRVANTAADTYFDLQVKYDGTPQPLELVAMDGIPMNADPTLPKKSPLVHIALPPGGRAEFIIKGPSPNVKNAEFLTLNFDTNADKDPERILAKIQLDSRPLTSLSTKEANVDLSQVSGDRFSGLSQMNSQGKRTLYFSQNDPTKEFYITEEGKQPKVYDMNAKKPNITVTEGTTEDWIVENRAQEAHAFHIHQIHFLVLNSPESNEVGMLRDTISVPAWDGKSTTYPQVRLRMDFRGKGSSIAGTFVYHCHILEHEDGGMMGSIEVLKKA